MSQGSAALLPSSFTDGKGNQWTIRFTGKSMVRIREELGINICDAMGDRAQQFFQSLETHHAMGMAWIALRDDVADKGMTAEDFMEGLAGQALLDFNDAFWAALLNFSQGEKQLATFAKLIARTRTLVDRKLDEAGMKLDQVTDEELETLLNEAMATQRTGTSSSSPDFAASTRAE